MDESNHEMVNMLTQQMSTMFNPNNSEHQQELSVVGQSNGSNSQFL